MQEQFKRIRDEKVEHLAKLRDIVKECTRLMNKLKASLPNTNLKAEQIVQMRDRALGKSLSLSAKAQKGSKSLKPKERSDLEKLDDELNHIESKLNSLS